MKNVFILFCSFSITFAMAQSTTNKTIYFLPGTGANGQLFKNISIEKYDTVCLEYFEPYKNESFESYIERMASKIDTTERYSIIGVSLGGMIATELAEILDPEEVIIISSAKAQTELPNHYHLFRYLPIHYLIGGRSMIWGTKLLQPYFEPMEEEGEELFRAMLNEKSPHFIKSAVRWMIDWKRNEYRADIIHIHGDKDRTLPIKNITPDYTIKDGGHMIVYSQAEEISVLLNKHLK